MTPKYKCMLIGWLEIDWQVLFTFKQLIQETKYVNNLISDHFSVH